MSPQLRGLAPLAGPRQFATYYARADATVKNRGSGVRQVREFMDVMRVDASEGESGPGALRLDPTAAPTAAPAAMLARVLGYLQV